MFIDPASYLTFLAASIALILVPGPAQALVIARTLSGGKRAGALTAVGLNIGTLFHAAAAALGLSAILATSALAFSVVKYVGAAYLLYLGIQALRSRPDKASGSVPDTTAKASLGQAVATGILNPKVAIFFLAFLPQFVDPARGSAFAQFLILGASMAVLDTVYELLLVQMVARTRQRFLASPRTGLWLNRLTGGVLIGLGARLALQER
jgi:threonine/homoserine/homoserine lactone efflux protein